MSKSKLLISVITVALVAGGGLYYYQSADGKSAPASVEATKDVLVFTSPPREPAEEGEITYKPIAEYLSQVTGKRVVYKYPSTWGLYRTEMLNSSYDIIFDGGQFTDFRAQKLGYHIIAKMPELQEFAIIVRKDENVKATGELAGQTVCTPPPPNQGALILLSLFEDPTRQPVLVPVTGNFWKGVYDNVVAGRCKGGVLVMANLKKFDKEGAVKIVHKTPPQPNQGWSVGPRVTPEDREKIAAAITAPEAAAPTQKLRERFNVGERFVSATNAEYAEAGLAKLLRNEWGFSEVLANSK